jgi:hypothetical protein
MTARSIALVAGALLSLASCGDGDFGSPTRPTGQPAHPAADESSFLGTGTVIAASGSVCGWAQRVGDTRDDMQFRFRREGDSITIDEDMANWPTDHSTYHGTVSGFDFAATGTYPGGDVCDYRGGEFSGSFTEDGRRFDATAVYYWGSEGSVGRIETRWVGTRLF